MSTIMVIPGAAAQIPLIKRLRELRFKVVCVNPYEDSPAFPYADYTEQYDILDVSACTQIARKYKVCAVISDECDIAMPTVAAVSEALGIPSIGSKLAGLYTNKRKMREFSAENGFPCPLYKQCGKLEEAEAFFSSLQVPKMIIKPLDSNSSRGVYTITAIDDLRASFTKAFAFSRSTKAVLCEEFIEGTEFTVDGIVLNGKHYSLAVSKKKHYVHHKNIACELYFSHADAEFDYEQLRKQNDEYVEATGLPFGFTHAEYKYNGKEFVLIEIGARGGGNYISSHIVPIMTGIDNYKLLIEHTLDTTAQDTYALTEKYRNRCCVLKFFDVEAENNGLAVQSVSGEELLREDPRVLMYQFNFEPGDVIYMAADDSKRVGFYIAYAETRDELNCLMEHITETVRFNFY